MTTLTGSVQNTQQVEGTVLDPARVTAEVLVAIKGDKGDPGEGGGGMDGDFEEVTHDWMSGLIDLSQTTSDKIKCTIQGMWGTLNNLGVGTAGTYKTILFTLSTEARAMTLLTRGLPELMNGDDGIYLVGNDSSVTPNFMFQKTTATNFECIAICIGGDRWILAEVSGLNTTMNRVQAVIDALTGEDVTNVKTGEGAIDVETLQLAINALNLAKVDNSTINLTNGLVNQIPVIQEIGGVKSFGYSSNFRFVDGALMLANDVEIHSFAPESSGGGNMFIGKNAGNKTMNGTAWRSSYNIGIGMGALRSLVTGFTNFGLGNSALYNCTDGYYNFALGDATLYNLTTGYNNIGIGINSGFTLTTGSNNFSMGVSSLTRCVSGVQNTAIGNYTLLNYLGSYATAVGYEALKGNDSGEFNTAFGYQALTTATSGNNTAVGAHALDKILTGGGYNTAIGTLAGRYYYGGGSNFNTTGENGTFIGYDTRAQSNGGTNEIVIGYAAMGNGSDTVTLGNDSITKTILKGSVGIGYTGISSTFNAALTVRGWGNTTGKTLSLYNLSNVETVTVLDKGWIGINRPSPNAMFDVNGEIWIGEYLTANKIYFGSTTNYIQRYRWQTTALSTIFDTSNTNIGANIIFSFSNDVGLLVSRDGNSYFKNGLAIGNTTHAKQLEVSHATGDCFRISFDKSPTLKADFTLDYLGNLTIASAGFTYVSGLFKSLTAKFGTDTNYTEFEADGTLKMNGAATVFEDLLPTIANANTGGAAPDMVLMGGSGTIRAQRFANISASEEYQPCWQLPHSWKEGSDVIPHLHLYIPDSGTGGDIVFTMIYTWQNIDDGTMTETTVTSTPITRANNAGIDGNALCSFGVISGAGKTISSLFAARIMRVQGGADTFSGDVFLRSADMHIEIDTLGSRTATTK